MRDDAIVATGRSDYPNQINNVLGFPFIFRGALDVQASTINEAMKIAAAEALAELARAEVPDQVAAAFLGRRPTFGPDYIIPAPFDPRLIVNVPTAVAKAAMDSGVARKPIVDMDSLRRAARGPARSRWPAGCSRPSARCAPTPSASSSPKAEEPAVIRAAHTYFTQGFGQPILIGTSEIVREQFRALGMVLRPEYELIDIRKSPYLEEFTDYPLRAPAAARLSEARLPAPRHQRAQRLRRADGRRTAMPMRMVSGVTRNWTTVFQDVHRVMDAEPGRNVIGVSLALLRGRAVLIADTSVHDMPTAEQLANIAVEAARAARNLRHRAARGAARLLDLRAAARRALRPGARGGPDPRRAASVDFEYDGDMAADVALNRDLMRHYPFCRLTDTANVLDHAGVPRRLDLDQDAEGARRRDHHRADPRRPVALGADLLVRRQGHRHRQHGGDRGLRRQRAERGCAPSQSLARIMLRTIG